MKQVNQVKLGAEYIAKRDHREMHDRCLWAARMRRDKVAASIPEWKHTGHVLRCHIFEAVSCIVADLVTALLTGALRIPDSISAGCLWAARMRRDKVAASIPEWEEMRELASQIKLHTLSNLDKYLEQFVANAEANGIHVHWARNAEEHNEIIKISVI